MAVLTATGEKTQLGFYKFPRSNSAAVSIDSNFQESLQVWEVDSDMVFTIIVS